MPGTWPRCFVVFSVISAATQAAPPLTEIQDVLYKADGSLFDGYAQIDWKSFQSADGAEVPQNSVSIRVVRGRLRIALVPTTNAIRSVVYTVRFNSEGRTQFVESWAVPPASAILRLRDVRTIAPVAGNLNNGPVITSIQDVTGLRAELDLRPARGASWVPGRAAVIGTSGALEAVAGADGDCIRVDGTSGPCGASLLVDGERPAGAKNGINNVFRLSTAPSPPASLRFFRNGLLMIRDQDFTLAGPEITMLAGRTPVPSDVLQAWYRTSGNAVSIVDSETPAGLVDGVNAVFTLTSPPLPAASLQVYRNGVLQAAAVDYALTADIVTFLPVSIPLPGDILQVSYRK